MQCFAMKGKKVKCHMLTLHESRLITHVLMFAQVEENKSSILLTCMVALFINTKQSVIYYSLGGMKSDMHTHQIEQ